MIAIISGLDVHLYLIQNIHYSLLKSVKKIYDNQIDFLMKPSLTLIIFSVATLLSFLPSFLQN